MSQARWRRDASIQDMIDYFEQPRFMADGKYDIRLVSAREWDFIQQEILRCRRSFEYTARNYFWIKNEKREDQLFQLWESQEIILDRIYSLWSQGLTAKVLILKARRLGCSTLIEGIIAWNTMFYENVNSLVISYDPSHAARLFAMLLNMYDRMPWFLKPPTKYKKYEEGIVFDEPDGSPYKGLSSQIIVDAANAKDGISGVGDRITNLHSSEHSRWPGDRAQQIIESDVGPAISVNGNGLAALESTAKGAGTYYHDLWKRMVERGERANWLPIFLPFFFEKSRVIAPPQGWAVEKKEADIREKVKDSWLRCDNAECGQYYEATVRGESQQGASCRTCRVGILMPFVLSDDQLCWLWRQRINAEGDEQAMRNLAQEYAWSPEVAFQISGEYVFPRRAMESVFATIRKPISVGDLDSKGVYHAKGKGRPCIQEWCTLNHDYMEAPLSIWEFPIPGARYAIGVDPASGDGGNADFCVIWVNRIGRDADYQVAMFRSNTTDPVGAAHYANYLGRWYNEAILAPEVNKFDLLLSTLRFKYLYPNIYRQKNVDGTGNLLKNKFGFLTTPKSKNNAIQLMSAYLGGGSYYVRSEVAAEEIKTFQKESWDDLSGRAASSRFKDDTIIAAAIALYAAHDVDARDDIGYIAIRNTREDAGPEKEWTITCQSCREKFDGEGPDTAQRCPKCNSIFLSFGRKSKTGGYSTVLDPAPSQTYTEASPDKPFSAL